VLRQVQRGEFPPPRQIGPAIDRALEAVCLKAMALAPEDRYASCRALADEVERWMADEPVAAYREPWTDRGRRRLKQHRTAVAAVAASAAVALVATATIAVLESRSNNRLASANLQLQEANTRAERDRDRAEGSFRQARQAVNQFFTRVSEERLLDQPGLHPVRKALLQDAQRIYEDFLKQRGEDFALRVDLAAARMRVAHINGQIGADAEARAQFELAVAAWEELVKGQPDNADCAEKLASTLNDQAVLLMSQRGRREEALAALGHARAILEPLVAEGSGPASRRRELGMVLVNSAAVHHLQGRPREAIRDLQRATAIESQLAAENKGSVNARVTLANAHALLGRMQSGQPGGMAAARASYEEATRIMESVVRERPELANESYVLASHLGDLHHLQQLTGQGDSALLSLRRGLAIIERLAERYPDVRDYQRIRASTTNMMSDLHRRRAEPSKSLAYARKALDLLGRLTSEHPGDGYIRMDEAKAYNNMGRCLQQSGEPDRRRREENGRRAIDMLRRAWRGGFMNPEILQSDTDLDPIRERPDFRLLVQDLAFPTQPFATGR
jgi:tetratricopeptide (TPR) repeat protein